MSAAMPLNGQSGSQSAKRRPPCGIANVRPNRRAGRFPPIRAVRPKAALARPDHVFRGRSLVRGSWRAAGGGGFGYATRERRFVRSAAGEPPGALGFCRGRSRDPAAAPPAVDNAAALPRVENLASPRRNDGRSTTSRCPSRAVPAFCENPRGTRCRTANRTKAGRGKLDARNERALPVKDAEARGLEANPQRRRHTTERLFGKRSLPGAAKKISPRGPDARFRPMRLHGVGDPGFATDGRGALPSATVRRDEARKEAEGPRGGKPAGDVPENAADARRGGAQRAETPEVGLFGERT